MGCNGSKQRKDAVAGKVVPSRLFGKQSRDSSKSKQATATAGADRGSKEATEAKADDPARVTSSDEFYSSRKDMESLDAVIEGSEGAEYHSPGEVDSEAVAVVDVHHAGDKIAPTGNNGGEEAEVGSSSEAHATVRSEAKEEIKNKRDKEEEFTISTVRHNSAESIGSNGSMDFKEMISAEQINEEITIVSEKKYLRDQNNVKEHSTSH